MTSDAATKAWLVDELTSALGFAEVDDIAAYVLSSFGSKQEVAAYLTELLGISPSRAETISARVVASPTAPTSKPAKQQGGAKATKVKVKTAVDVPHAGAAVGLVPQAAMPNSRLKAAKPRKTGAPKMLHTRIINCLQCGKIEHNGGRKCTFCGSELRYEELDEHEIDRAAQTHMETLVHYDETSAERTTVVDVDTAFYEEVGGDDSRSGGGAVTLDLDLETRQFVLSRSSERMRRNDALTKDARSLCEGVQRRLEKAAAASSRKSGTSVSGQRADAPVALAAAAEEVLTYV